MNKKILIIQKDEHQAKALSFILAGTGFTTRYYTNAESALSAAQTERFDLAITDNSAAFADDSKDFVSGLKKAQPALTIFLIAEQKDLDSVIQSIRSGVADIIDGPGHLQKVIDQTLAFLNPDSSDDEVSAADLFEVEQVLKSLNGNTAEDHENDSEDTNATALQKRLNEALNANKELSSKLTISEKEARLAKERYEQLHSNSDCSGAASPEVLKRLDSIEERENDLSKRERLIAKQKSELEIQLGELDVQRFELEERIAKSGIGEIDNSELENEIKELKKANDQILLKSNERRLELEARIKDLTLELKNQETQKVDTTIFESQIDSLKTERNELQQKISELEFIAVQKDEQIEKLKENLQSEGSTSPLQEEIEEKNRLLEIEAFKLKEKIDRFQLEKSDFEKDHEKRLRELQVERRDAEISLREMQAQLKEEQLKCHVEKATFDEEKRQFAQAQQNFQEDVQNLQRQQSELIAFEQKLQKMQRQFQDGESPASALPESPPAMRETIDQNATTPETRKGDKNDPNSWGKPAIEKQGRGPLRIGRRSAF